MKFTVLPADLKAAVAEVGAVVQNKCPMPVYTNVLIRPCSETTFLITACDGDITVTAPLQVFDCEDAVNTIIPFAELSEFVKNAIGVFPIEFSFDGSQWCISDTSGDFKFVNTYRVEEFPLPSSVQNGTVYTVDTVRFIAAVTAAKGFTLLDELRPVMNGVCVEFRADGIYVAASDSKSLYREIIRRDNATQGSVIIPVRLINILKTINLACDEALTISITDKNIQVSQGVRRIVSSIIEGKYPRYDAVIPRPEVTNRKVEVVTSKFIYGITRAGIAANQTTQQVKLSFDGGTSLTVSSQDVDFSKAASVRVETASQHDTDGFAIGVRAQVISKVVKSVGASSVILSMSDASRPIVITSASDADADRLILCMPMQLVD